MARWRDGVSNEGDVPELSLDLCDGGDLRLADGLGVNVSNGGDLHLAANLRVGDGADRHLGRRH